MYLAEKVLEEISLTNSDTDFISFKKNFIEEFYEVEGDNVADFTRIWNWFKPNAEWNIYTKNNGLEIGEKIFEITDYWKKNF